MIVKITLLIILLIASPLAIPIVESHTFTFIDQDRIWREMSIVVDTDYIVNVKLSIDKDDVYWDMSKPVEIYVEASPIKYPENASKTYVIIHIEYMLNNNVIDYNDYYVGFISPTRNLLLNTVTLYPTPKLIQEILNESTALIQLRSSIIISTIYRDNKLETIQSEYMSPFTIYVGLNEVSETPEARLEYARVIVGDDILNIKSYTQYRWDIDTGIPSIWIEITPAYMNTTGLNAFIKIYTENNQLLSSEYLGELDNTSMIQEKITLPEDIVKTYSQAKGYITVLLSIVLESGSVSYSIDLVYILRCSFEKPAIVIDVSLPKTVYSGIPIDVTITIQNNDLEKVYVKEVFVVYEDREYAIDVDRVLDLGESFIKEIALKFNSSGKILVEIVARILLLERYTELDIGKTIGVYVVNPLIVSVDKRICLPGEKLVLSINTVFINKTISIIMMKANGTIPRVIDTLIVSFPGTRVEITAPETPGTYIIQAITSDNIRSNIIKINVSVVSYKVNLVAKNTKVEPGSKLEFVVEITPSPKESLDIAILRFEELMGTWILVPGTVAEQSNGKYSVVLKAPDKSGNYRFKARVALKGKIIGESNPVIIVVGNNTAALSNATSTSTQVVNQTTNLPLFPSEYTIGVLAIIPIVSILLWRKYKRK